MSNGGTKTVWAIQHVGHEDLGSFEPVLKARGFNVHYLCSQYVDYADLDAGEADLIVDLGAPIAPYDDKNHPWIPYELEFIKRRIESQKPLMGICFGAQIIARALGAPCYKGDAGKELGWSKISVNEDGIKTPLRHFDGELTHMMHWHGDTFELPEGTTLLASSDLYQNQAYSYGAHVLGVQCHPEITESKLNLWYDYSAADLKDVGTSVEKLKAAAHEYAQKLTEQTALFLNEWLDEQGF